jgi:diphthine synthase
MLALIGLGLDSGDISSRALDFIRSAGIVYADKYTSIIGQRSIDFVKEKSGMDVTDVPRGELEERVKATVAKAKGTDMAILVIGDPLIATTHHIILDEAQKQGISVKIFHAPSIFSAAIGESGLDIYKFGPTTTVPFWSERYKPTSFIDVIHKNLTNLQHTLVLFDIDPKGPSPMSIAQAAEIIGMADRNAYLKDSRVVVLGDIGRETQDIFYTELSKLQAYSKRLEGKTISIIVPAELNFAEEDALKRFGT